MESDLFMMSYLIDVILLIVSIVIIAVFTKRGFIRSLFNYGKTLLAIAAAYFIGPKVGGLFYNKFVHGLIYNWVYSQFNSVLDSVAQTIDIESIIEALPFVVKKFVSADEIKAKYGETIINAEAFFEEFSDFVSSPFAKLIANLLAYLLVFLVALLLLFVLNKIFDFLTRLPIIHGVNTWLGFALGVIAAFVFLSLITYVFGLVTKIFGDIPQLEKIIENSYLLKLFNRLNLFKVL